MTWRRLDYFIFEDWRGQIDYQLELPPDECEEDGGVDDDLPPRPHGDWFAERDIGGGRTIVCDREDRISLLCHYWNELRAGCASPIELKFADAFMWEATFHEQRYPFVVPKWDHWRTKSGFTIQPQHKVSPYRADFALALCQSEDHPGGVYRPKECPHGFFSYLVVECDGHEFHERTKEQASRDKSRDRHLLMEGWPVMRFTGSEIHADARACARQAIAALNADIKRQEQDTQELRSKLHEVWALNEHSPWHGWKGDLQ